MPASVHSRHAGTADYASDGEEAAKRVRVRKPLSPPPPPPQPEIIEVAAPDSPPPPNMELDFPPGISESPDISDVAGGLDVGALEISPPKKLSNAEAQTVESAYPKSPSLPAPDTEGYNPFASPAAQGPSISWQAPDNYDAASLSHYVPLEPLVSPEPRPSVRPLPMARISANPQLARARAPIQSPVVVSSSSVAQPPPTVDMVPADVDTLLRCG